MKQTMSRIRTTSKSTSNRAATLFMMIELPWDSNVVVTLVQDNAAGRSSSQLALSVPGIKPLCRWTSASRKSDRVAKTEASHKSISPPKRPLRRHSWAVEAVTPNDEHCKQCIEDAPKSATAVLALSPLDRLSPPLHEESIAISRSATMA
jgi:hypothetical protein